MIDIDSEIKSAIRDKQTTRLAVCRQLKTAIGNVLSAKGRDGKLLDLEEQYSIVRKLIAQRDESIALYEKANRLEALETEKREKVILQSFLPEPLSDLELEAIVAQAILETAAVSRKDTGRAITRAKELSAGKADPRILSQFISAKLS
jgi:hypothetical protein